MSDTSKDLTAMLINGIAQALVDNIPAYLNNDVVATHELTLRLVEVVPSSHFLCDFNNDTWDAREGFVRSRRVQNVIHFEICNPEFKSFMKGYALQKIDDGTKFSTLHATVRLLAKTLNLAIEKSERRHFIFIKTENVIDAAKELYSQSVYDWTAVLALVKEFFRFLNKEANLKLLISEKELKEEYIRIHNKYRRYAKHRHHPDIPDELFNIIINKCDDVMRNESCPLNDRLLAGMILINSQLGCRQSEIPAMETDCRGYWECEDGVTRPYITYWSIKAARGDVEALPVKTFCNQICDETLSYYLELRKKCIYADKTDFLLVLDPRQGARNGEFPVDANTFCELYKKWMAEYLGDELLKDWKGIGKIKAKTGKYKDEYLSVPTIHSYRVHFMGVHARKGTPLEFIDCAVSHTPQDDLWNAYGGGVPAPQPNDNKNTLSDDEQINYIDLFNSSIEEILDE